MLRREKSTEKVEKGNKRRPSPPLLLPKGRAGPAPTAQSPKAHLNHSGTTKGARFSVLLIYGQATADFENIMEKVIFMQRTGARFLRSLSPAGEAAGQAVEPNYAPLPTLPLPDPKRNRILRDFCPIHSF